MRRRFRKWPKWAAVVALAAILTTAPLSWSNALAARCHNVEVVASGGRLLIARVIPQPLSARPLGDAPLEVVRRYIEEQRSFETAAVMHARGSPWRFRWMTSAPYWGLSIPLWAPSLLLAVIAGLLWWRDHFLTTRGRTGGCASCGYNRRGLAADAKCPECGMTPTPTRG